MCFKNSIKRGDAETEKEKSFVKRVVHEAKC